MTTTPAAPVLLSAVPAVADEIVDGAMYSTREVRGLISRAERRGEERGARRGRDSAWAEARRRFEDVLGKKVAELEAKHRAERASLIAEVAAETAARLKGTVER